MANNFEVILPIREDLSKCFVFGLEAKLPVALILRFVDYRHEVMPKMQRLSHCSRAYILNPSANKLTGFVKSFDIMEILKEADKNGKLDHCK